MEGSGQRSKERKVGFGLIVVRPEDDCSTLGGVELRPN